jgi:glycine betaine/proline transport system substrate-binding protein
MQRGKMRNTWAPVLLVSVAIGLLATVSAADDSQKPGEGKTIEPARATWTTGFFLEAVYSRALEDLGYEVKDPKKLSNPIFYQALVNGDVDFWANGWFPLHNTQIPKDFFDKASIAGTVAKGGALQGYLVSKKAADQFEIKSLADFKRPEVKKAFDANGDGKADLVACPPGWGCEKAITQHLDDYGLNDHINAIKASYTASMADALARFNNDEPILFYTWTPNWTVYKLKPGEDVMWINVPDESVEEASGIPGAVTDPIRMGFPPNDIQVCANQAFLKENPAAARLFQVMSIPLEDIARQNNRMNEGENTEKDVERHVTEWKTSHQETWEGWLEEARKAAM